MKTRHFFPAIMICHIGILLLMSCGGQPQNTASDGVSFKNDDAFHQALREQAADINEVNQKAEQQRAEQQRAEIERRERMEREYQEEKRNMLKSQILETLQGTWEWSGNIKISSYRSQKTVSQLVIEGDYITEYSDGNLVENSKIRDIDYENGKIYYGSDSYLVFVIGDGGGFYLYGDEKRSVRFKKLSEKSVKAREDYNKHLQWWKDSYKEYMNPNPYWNSRPESIKGMQRALDYLWDDVHKSGNSAMEEHVKELSRITSGLTPY